MDQEKTGLRQNRRWAWRAGVAAVLIAWLVLGSLGGPTVASRLLDR